MTMFIKNLIKRIDIIGYTKDYLFKIRNAYNKKNPLNKITSNTPSLICSTILFSIAHLKKFN